MNRTSYLLGSLLVVSLSLGTSAQAQEPDSQGDPLAALRFLVGEWEGTISGPLGEGSGVRVYESILDDTYLTFGSCTALQHARDERARGRAGVEVGVQHEAGRDRLEGLGPQQVQVEAASQRLAAKKSVRTRQARIMARAVLRSKP